jgi:hypothetical protein
MGEIDMADRLPRLVEHLAEGKRDRLQPGEKTLILLSRYGGEHAVLNRGCAGFTILLRGDWRAHGQQPRLKATRRMYVNAQNADFRS